jgi:alkylhydroperoxidase family enzyme
MPIPMLSTDEAKAAAVAAGLPEYLAGPNVMRFALRHPKVARVLADMIDVAVMNGALDARLREVAILRVGWRIGSIYEWSNHAPIGARAGLSDVEVIAIRAADAKVRSAADLVAIAVVDEVLDTVTVAATLAEGALLGDGDELLELVAIPLLPLDRLAAPHVRRAAGRPRAAVAPTAPARPDVTAVDASDVDVVSRTGKATCRGAHCLSVLTVITSACSRRGRPRRWDRLPTGPGDASSTTASGTTAGPARTCRRNHGRSGPVHRRATGRTVPEGYVEHEYVASGTATAFATEGPLSRDGRWTFVPDTTAAYRTRILVRRPADTADSSGTVVVEWLNVSGGLDANPDYASLEEEIARQGHTWVGVSAQLIGVEGGPVLVKARGAEAIVGKGLKALDPARYGSLEHPGDGYSFDIYTQVARAVREGGPAAGGTKPRVVLAAGESQSALALTTYYNGVQPLTRAFDGFLVHSRASVSLPLVAPGEYADPAADRQQHAGGVPR